MQFAEWEACVAAGLDLYKWALNKYPLWFKAKVVAFNKLRNLVVSHTESAKAQALDKKAKKRH